MTEMLLKNNRAHFKNKSVTNYKQLRRCQLFYFFLVITEFLIEEAEKTVEISSLCFN